MASVPDAGTILSARPCLPSWRVRNRPDPGGNLPATAPSRVPRFGGPSHHCLGSPHPSPPPPPPGPIRRSPSWSWGWGPGPRRPASRPPAPSAWRGRVSPSRWTVATTSARGASAPTACLAAGRPAAPSAARPASGGRACGAWGPSRPHPQPQFSSTGCVCRGRRG